MPRCRRSATSRSLVVAMTLDDLPDILTVREAAAYLRIGLNSAYALTRQWRLSGGREGLGYVPVGRGQRIPKVELVRFLAKPPVRRTA